MQTLTLNDVKRAAWEYFKRGKLLAQHPNSRGYFCVYAANDGYCCAVGAALTQDTINKILAKDHNDANIYVLCDAEIVKVPDEDWDTISGIQQVHDLWMGTDPLSDGWSKAKEQFLDLIAGPWMDEPQEIKQVK